MLVSEAIQQIKDRAGIHGDEFYSENDLLAALQTAFETYANILLSRTPGRLVRRLSVTPTAERTPLPADVAVIRSVWQDSPRQPIRRMPSDSPLFSQPGNAAYDVETQEGGSVLVVSPALINVSLIIRYLPAVPRLAFNNPSGNPLIWTEIPESLFPVHGIIQAAVAEVLGKDRDPAATMFAQLAQSHLQAWAASLMSQVAQVDPHGQTVRRMVSEIVTHLSESEPDSAREMTILNAIQRAVSRIHRIASVVAEDLVKTSASYTVSSWPLTIERPDIFAVLSVLVKDGDGTWKFAGHGDRTVHQERLGDFYDIHELPSGMTRVYIWSVGRATPPVEVNVSYIPKAPTIEDIMAEGNVSDTLYPPHVVVPMALGDLSADPQEKVFWEGKAREQLALFADELRQLLYWRSFSRTSRRIALIEAVRHILGSPLHAEWRNQTIELVADLVRQEIARRIRLIHQGFFESKHVVPATQYVTRITLPTRWVRIVGVYHYPATTQVRQFYELIKGDKDSPEFARVAYLWDNEGYDIILSGPGIIGGEVVVTYLTHPAVTAGVVTAEDPDDILFPLDVVAYLVAARLLVGFQGDPSDLSRGQYIEAMAQHHLKVHLAEVARLFHRHSGRRRLPLKMNYL